MGKVYLPDERMESICYTDGTKTKEGTRAGVYGYGRTQRFSFSLGSTKQYFRLTYKPSKHVLIRILKGAIKMGTLYSLTTRSELKWLNTICNDSCRTYEGTTDMSART
jgi:hypothetical protein